jgi:hypothetical protein
VIQQPPHTVTIEDLYDLMCRYLIDNGWTRQEEGSGWWWKEDAPEGEGTIGGAVEQQLDLDGLDTRIMRAWEPYEFWPAEDDAA